MEEPLHDNIDIKLPVKIGYEVLETLLRERIKGETIQVEKENGEVTRYAEILDVTFGQSRLEYYDFTIDIHFRTLTRLFSRKTGSILFHVAVEFDENDQMMYVSDYRLKGNSANWLMNKTIETVANKFLYKKMKGKMKVDFRPHIKPEIDKLNRKLENDLEAAAGIFISGKMNNVKIVAIIPQERELLILVHLQGGTAVEITQIKI